jgi:acyl dehydratase
MYRRGEAVWDGDSVYLKRGVPASGDPLDPLELGPDALQRLSRWQLAPQLGRDYAKVSGDYNPIHLSAASARLFGFPAAIAHGLWNKARTLAALADHLPRANLEITVHFRKPVRLPSKVSLFASAAGSSGELRLIGAADLEHMVGHWQPIA